MKSRTSAAKTSSTRSKRRKGLSGRTKVVGATTLGALAGGLVGTAIANRRNPKSTLGKTAQKVKTWVKSAVKSPTTKSLVRGVAEQMAASQLRTSRSGKGRSTRTMGKAKKK